MLDTIFLTLLFYNIVLNKKFINKIEEISLIFLI
jgi:hypothetical protein